MADLPNSFYKNDGWQNLKGKSVEWKDINIPENDSKFMFTTVYSRIKDTDSAFGNAHENCRITFFTKGGQSVKRHGYTYLAIRVKRKTLKKMLIRVKMIRKRTRSTSIKKDSMWGITIGGNSFDDPIGSWTDF